MTYWSVPRTFDGGTVACLAGGPSMSAAVAEMVRSAGVPAIVVNNAFRLAPWAWMLYAADVEWWTHPQYRDAHGFQGLKVSCGQPTPGVLRLKHTGRTGFDPDPSAVRTGGNSGYQALHIAVHAGAARVLLCGYDMHRTEAEHWHGAHPADLKVTSPDIYRVWRDRYAELARILSERGVDVVNCTPGSALDCFRRASLSEALKEAACVAQ